jgi:phytol kinase
MFVIPLFTISQFAISLFAIPIGDLAVTVLVFCLCLVWLRSMDYLADRGILGSKLSRKIIHIGTGPLFILCWPLYSAHPLAPYLAALVPATITVQFLAIGLGWLQDPAAVQALTRHGNPREILTGPLHYGLGFIICTVVFWRSSPTGIVALMLLCGGDGLADVVGRRWGRHKLPFNPDKSWIGSVAMALGGMGFSLVFLALFHRFGYFEPPLEVGATIAWVGLIALVATVVEALPLAELDNLAILTVSLLLGLLGWRG